MEFCFVFVTKVCVCVCVDRFNKDVFLRSLFYYFSLLGSTTVFCFLVFFFTMIL